MALADMERLGPRLSEQAVRDGFPLVAVLQHKRPLSESREPPVCDRHGSIADSADGKALRVKRCFWDAWGLA